MNLCEVHEKLGTTEQCLEYIEKMRWPDGVKRCPTCGWDKVVKVERKADSKNNRGWFYLCQEPTCHQQFSPTAGTLFHDSHLPLIKWFQAIALVLNAKKGISAMQLKRDLGVSYKTAWYLYHRIREIMAEGEIPKLGGIVEIDETYVGGARHGRKYQGRRDHKICVVGMKQRGGKLRLFHAPDAKIETLARYIKEHVSADVEAIMTDELPAYPKALRISGHDEIIHKTVNHTAGIYSYEDVTTNGIESAFSLFKRGIVGQYHKISAKHLWRYLNESCYRFNARDNADAFGATVRRLCGFPPLTFASLTSEESEPF
jgi:transposase-like protein